MVQATTPKKTRTRSAPRRRPGRPPQKSAAADVPKALLDASRKLFVDRGFHEVSTREIARAAGVNPAMIHYYFGDKEGLYRAMLGDVFDGLVSGLGDIAGHSQERSPIVELLELYVGTLSRNPWVPRLMVREVLSDGAPFREEFIERFARPASRLVPGLMTKEKRKGRLRRDLDPTLATLSLMGMTLFPFLAFPIASRVFGLKLDDDFHKRFLDHTVKLFLQGAEQR